MDVHKKTYYWPSVDAHGHAHAQCTCLSLRKSIPYNSEDFTNLWAHEVEFIVNILLKYIFDNMYLADSVIYVL